MPGPHLLIQTAHLGDAVLTLPLLVALAERHGPVDVLTTPEALPLLRGQAPVGELIPYDKHGRDRGVGGMWRMARRLAQGRYRTAWLPHRSFRTGMLARLAGIPERIGYGGSAGRLWYTSRVPLPATGHQVARLAALAGATPAPPPWFTLAPEAIAEAEAWLAGAAVPDRFIVLAPGARWHTKRWPGFVELAASLTDPVVVVGGPGDREVGEAIVRAAGGRAANAAGVLSLPGSAALIARSRLLVSNDSLPLHLASGLGRPVVAIFGPTVPGFGFGPLGPADRVVEHEGLPCRPCSPHGPMRCPLGHHRCMREIGAPAVVAAVERVLAGAGDPAGRGSDR